MNKIRLFVLSVIIFFFAAPVSELLFAQQTGDNSGSSYSFFVDINGNWFLKNQDEILGRGKLESDFPNKVLFPQDTKRITIYIQGSNTILYEYEFKNEKSETLDYQALKKLQDLLDTAIPKVSSTNSDLAATARLSGTRNTESSTKSSESEKPNIIHTLFQDVEIINNINSPDALKNNLETIKDWPIEGNGGIEQQTQELFKSNEELLKKSSQEDPSKWTIVNQRNILWAEILKTNQASILEAIAFIKKFQNEIAKLDTPVSYVLNINKNENANCSLTIKCVDKYFGKLKSEEKTKKYIWNFNPNSRWNTRFEVGVIQLRTDSSLDKTFFAAGILTHMFDISDVFGVGFQAGLPTGLSGVFVGGCFHIYVIKFGAGGIYFKDIDRTKWGWYIDMSLNVLKIFNISGTK